MKGQTEIVWGGEVAQEAAEWKEVTVEDIKADFAHALSTGPFGSAISSKYFLKSGVPVIRGANLSQNVTERLTDQGLVFISPEKAQEFHRSVVRKGDLIFTCWGTINQVGLIDGSSKYTEYVISNKQMKFTPDSKKADAYFLYYLFSSPDYQSIILNNDIGSSVPGFNLGQLRKMSILLPPLPEQRAIADVLTSLDDKIDLLHRQNATLEALAETLFRQWFVEEAQEDWEEVPVSDIIDFNPTYRLKKGESATYLEMSNVSSNAFNPSGWYKRDFNSGTKFKNGDTLLARITPCLENGKTAFVSFLEENEVGWGSTEFIVLRMKSPFHPFLSYVLARNSDFRDFAISSMSGSSGRQRVQTDMLASYSIKVPDKETIEKMNAQLEIILNKLIVNAPQIQTLTTLRDTLLPKLMSGEVRVSGY